MANFFTKIFGTHSSHELKKIYPIADKVEALEEQLGGILEIVRPQGGLFIWGTLPDKYDSAVFAKKAIGNMVAVVEGKTFMPDQSAVSHSFRMNYSTPTDEQIIEGVRRLRKTLDDYDA